MEEQLLQITGLGVAGTIGAILFNTFLKERSEERNIAIKNQQEDRALYRQSVETFTEVTQTFANSFEGLNEKVEGIENKIDILIDKGVK